MIEKYYATKSAGEMAKYFPSGISSNSAVKVPVKVRRNGTKGTVKV